MKSENYKSKPGILPALFEGSGTGSWGERNRRIIVTAFFAAFLLLAIGIVRDFGISYDEAINRENGYVSLGYLVKLVKPHFYKTHFSGLPDLQHYKDKDYGVFFELPAVIIENIFQMNVQSHIIYMRHFLTFLVFFTGLIFFYRMGFRQFNSWKTGLLGCIMLILSPRIFAQAFYNSKDVVFMSFFLIATYTLLRLLHRRNWQSAVLHALACTAAIDTRIMGILLPMATIGIIFLEVIKAPAIKQEFIKWAKLLLVYLIILVVFVVMCWPYLWASPLGNFIIAFQNMSKFRWGHSILFMGQNITPSKHISWYYIPVWIVISTPVVYTLLFVAGVFVSIKNIVKARFKLYADDKGRGNFIFLLLFFVPLLAVIFLNSVLYDAWRQMYFIYPPLLLLALGGFSALYSTIGKKGLLKCGLIATIIISFAFTTAFMVRSHPLEDVYFSCLPEKTAAKNFDLDYWGLSYRKGLTYIAQHDTSKNILIGYSQFSWVSRQILPEADQKRLYILTSKDTLNEKAGWMVTNFRFDSLPPGKYKKEVYAVYADKIKVLSVFKLR